MVDQKDSIMPAVRSRCPRIQDVYRLLAVAVDHGAELGATAPAGHLQGVDDQLGSHVIGDRPADHDPAEHVEDRGAVDLALGGGVLGDVGDPQPIRRIGDKPALHQIVVHRRRRPGSAVFASVTDTVRPAARISRATRLRPHASPSPRRISACTRGAP
jgi:hypothetical protein